MRRVSEAGPAWYQHLDRLAEHFVRCVAECPLDLWVDIHDPSQRVDRDDRVRRGFQDGVLGGDLAGARLRHPSRASS